MQKYLVLLGGASLIALAFPSAFERLRETIPAEPPIETAPAFVEVAAPAPPSPGRTVRLEADDRGHFKTEARLNGRPETVLVDTGATYVAVNETTARRLGLTLSNADFVHRANTANGEIAVALKTLDRIEIGLVSARDVDVMVARDAALSQTLLGMSFLGKLRRLNVADGRLELTE